MRKNLYKIIPTLIFMIMFIVVVTPTVIAAERLDLAIEVEVALSGELPTISENFTIKLTSVGNNNPMPDGSVDGISMIIIQGEGNKNFPKMTYTKVGEYNYTVVQEPGTMLNATYDSTIYDLTVFVTNGEMGLETTVIVKRRGAEGKSADIVFNNIYATPDRVKIRALKTLDGEDPLDEEFSFQLLNSLGDVVQTKPNFGQNIDFDEIIFDETGTFIYFIREEKGEDNTIRYDNRAYNVIVKVSKNEKGEYEADISYVLNGVPLLDIPLFENVSISGELPDTGGVKPMPGELPKTGEAKSALPMIGMIMILGGLTLTLRKKSAQ